MTDSLTFSPSSGKSQTPAPQVNVHGCEPHGTSCQQMAGSQTKDGGDVFTLQESNTFSLRTAAVSRRHRGDGTVSLGSGRRPADSNGLSPYLRQFSDGEVAGSLLPCSSPFSCQQGVCSPDDCSLMNSSSGEAPTSWKKFNNSIQCSYPDLPAAPVESSYFQSQSYPSYISSSPLQQVTSRLYPANDQANSSKYSPENITAQSHQRSPTQSFFPKPIYSYSILIFMALKNSKTGSLPVSEIYSFMTEHFPYFKTAPDGWKNSVRHNLSLNKCFEKVENKNGNSSRKGCLWALNPAKVEKMQEELHKWRRKDPVTVRRSMARPEDLDRLLGERPNKLRSMAPYTKPAMLSRIAPNYCATWTSCTSTQLRAPCRLSRRPPYLHIPPPSPQPCFLSPAATNPSSSFAQYSPCGQLPAAAVRSATGSLNASAAGKMPLAYNAALQAECSVGLRSMQDFLLEGDAGCDVDTLNPSLIDLQLQGNLWEELREDSLASDSQGVTTMTLSTPSVHQDPCVHTGCVQTSEVAVVGRCKADDMGRGQSFEQHGSLNGLHAGVYSGVDSLAGYLTCCTTSISLM